MDENYVRWLKDAYAMENEIALVLQGHLRDAENYRGITEKVGAHLEKTRIHADRLKDCIERNGGDVKSVNTELLDATGFLAGVSAKREEDKVLINSLSEFATEHFEIAVYRKLMTAAEVFEDSESLPVFREILNDEEEMAHWLDVNLPALTRETIGGRFIGGGAEGASTEA